MNTTQRPFIPAEILSQHALIALLPFPAAPVHLDIGTGLGHFIETLAARNPNDNWIGLEFDGKILKRAVRRVRKSAPNNTILFAVKAMPFLLESVPPQSLDHIWINFPDPWPKKKHADRRHTHPSMLKLISSRLKLDGALHLATDVPAYFAAMSTGVAEMSEFSPASDTLWQRKTLGVQTKYERKWLGQGKSIFYGDWQKTEQGESVAFDWQPTPDIDFKQLPKQAWYGEGRYRAKVFQPRKYSNHQCGFYLIDRETGISTSGILDAETGRIHLKGAWTAWKIDLMAAILA